MPLLTQQDLEAASQAIRSVDLPEHEYDGVARKLQKCLEVFLEADLRTCDRLELELEFDEPEGHGFLDQLQVQGKTAAIKDWKTTGSVGSPNYVSQQKHSWQTLMYLGLGGEWLRRVHGLQLTSIEYRCIDDDLSIKLVSETWQPWMYEKALKQLKQVERSYLKLNVLDAWPRNQPWACFKGSKTGPSCPYWAECQGEEKDLLKVLPTSEINSLIAKHREGPPRSKSSVGLFLDCPEKYRQEKLLGREGSGNLEQRLGSAFHNGIESLYRSAWTNWSKR